MSRIHILLLILWLTILLSGCAAGPAVTPAPRESVLSRLSDSREAAMGGVIAQAAWQQKGGVYPDDKLDDYVNRVGMRLARGSSRPGLSYRFKVVNDSAPNAFALPGGFVAISRGMLVELTSEAQLAAVLSHGIAHVEAGHAMWDSLEVEAVDLRVSSPEERPGYGPRERLTGEVSARLLDRAHSRDQEREADRLGIELMAKAGYDPWEMIRLQEFLLRKHESDAGSAWEKGLFKSHPLDKERVVDNRDYLRHRHPSSANGSPAQNFQPSLARLLESRQGYQWYDQGRRLEREGKLAAAVAAYLKAASAAPDESLILTGLGMAYLQSEEINAARIHLSRAVRLDNRYYYSRMGLGYAYSRQDRLDKAIDELEASMRLLPSLRGAYLLADAYEKSGNKQHALERYREVALADPRSKLGKFAAERVRALEEE